MFFVCFVIVISVAISTVTLMICHLLICHFKFPYIGVPPQSQLDETSLHMGELQQVIEDEELARKLQEEEETLLRRVRDPIHATL